MASTVDTSITRAEASLTCTDCILTRGAQRICPEPGQDECKNLWVYKLTRRLR